MWRVWVGAAHGDTVAVAVPRREEQLKEPMVEVAQDAEGLARNVLGLLKGLRRQARPNESAQIIEDERLGLQAEALQTSPSLWEYIMGHR
ncbi:MAG: hypothetical protein M0Z54_00025 [Thermaerobacter sp.]|nr:hypothetical protein [Thermaerobacter sp.]